MVARCPLGHLSTTEDYCDECGARLAGVDGSNAETNRSHRTEQVSTETPAPELCPRCCTPRSGGGRFCEHCGYDSTSAPEEVHSHWTAVIEIDRAHYERIAPPGLTYPGPRAATTFELDSDEVLIGRRSQSRGIRPDIDLSDTLDDPAVSHRHARITRRGDGSYALTDLGSTNGTALNDDADLLRANDPVTLSVGDRILLGAWTVITVHPAAANGPRRPIS